MARLTDAALSFVEAIRQVSHADAVWDELTTICPIFGVDGYMACTVRDPTEQSAGDRLAVYWYRAWADYYRVRHLRTRSPVTKMIYYGWAQPFLWSELRSRNSLTIAERLLLDEARDAGLGDALTVPIYGATGAAHVTFGAQKIDLDLEAITALQFIGSCAFSRAIELMTTESPRPSLSERELDCLRWAAAGKTTWEIGRILSIAESTVERHLAGACRQLDAGNRVHAVASAMRLGLLH